MACRGGRRGVHGCVQRSERRTAALAALSLHLPYCLRRRHGGAVRRDPLALRALIGGLRCSPPISAASDLALAPFATILVRSPTHGRRCDHPLIVTGLEGIKMTSSPAKTGYAEVNG